MLQGLVPNVEFHTCQGKHISALGRNVDATAGVIRTCLQSQNT